MMDSYNNFELELKGNLRQSKVWQLQREWKVYTKLVQWDETA